MPSSIDELEGFMRREHIAAFCTVDAKNKPHVVPMFFTYVSGKVYVHTDRKSVKVRNLLKNPNVAIEIHGGDYGEEAVVIRGQARIVPEDEFVIQTQEHMRKYHIELDEQGKDGVGVALFDNTVRCVVEVSVERLLFW